MLPAAATIGSAAVARAGTSAHAKPASTSSVAIRPAVPVPAVPVFLLIGAPPCARRHPWSSCPRKRSCAGNFLHVRADRTGSALGFPDRQRGERNALSVRRPGGGRDEERSMGHRAQVFPIGTDDRDRGRIQAL